MDGIELQIDHPWTRAAGGRDPSANADQVPEPDAALPAATHWRHALSLIERHLPFARRTLRAGRPLQTSGEAFDRLHVLCTGVAKVVAVSADGREQFVGVRFRGDWIGLDSIAPGRCVSDAIALDTCDVWSLHYDALVQACGQVPALLRALHGEMSAQLARERACRLAMATLCAEARLADFIANWSNSLHERGLRSDRIRLALGRSDIGSHLGLSHEAVSRAFTRLAQRDLLHIGRDRRRELTIPDLDALAAFVARSLSDTDGGSRSRRAAARPEPWTSLADNT